MKQLQKGFTLIELMIVVAIIGILAAVAIPAYQDYIAKAQATEAFSLLDGLKTPIAEAISQDSTNGCSSPAGAVTGGKYLSTIGFTAAGGPPITSCQMLATYSNANVSAKVSAQTVSILYDVTAGSWVCTTSLPAAVKPKAC